MAVQSAAARFLAKVKVGTPVPQRTSVIADTGSTICAFTCTGCRTCGQHLDANFDFSKSKTAEWVKCNRRGCDDCRMNYCAYRQSYTEGSSIEGFRFTDFVSLGDEFQENPPVKVQMGCHSRETKLFVTQKANGIFGLAPPKNKQPTVLMEIFKDRNHVNSAIFAMCLSSQGGLLTVGGFNESLNSAGVKWIPLSVQGFYSISLTKMVVEGGAEISGGFGHTIVDSGTTYTYLPERLYRQLKDAVKSYCESHNNCAAQGTSSTCWTVSGGSSLSSFPHIRVVFRDGVSANWYPSSYLYNRGGKAYCLGFESNGPVSETVLGATWMIGRNVIFDTQLSRLGMADAECPSFSQRPPGPTKVVSLDGSSRQAGQVLYLTAGVSQPIWRFIS
ncbi:A39 [Symbiodinium pilosum]|uniref:A39 protein n=1 Tax=Symbiodinium pilosum TaxID=2952 RepID=A0A812Q5W0_SYMPI|nr:A39 [Symbiodinium pilosum]